MKKLIQINRDTNEVLVSGSLADEIPTSFVNKLNEKLKRLKINKVWLVEVDKSIFDT